MLAMTAAVSCSSSPEAKAEKFVKEMLDAAKSKDLAKILTIATEADEYQKSLSEDQKAAFEKAMEELEEKYADQLAELEDIF